IGGSAAPACTAWHIWLQRWRPYGGGRNSASNASALCGSTVPTIESTAIGCTPRRCRSAVATGPLSSGRYSHRDGRRRRSRCSRSKRRPASSIPKLPNPCIRSSSRSIPSSAAMNPAMKPGKPPIAMPPASSAAGSATGRSFRRQPDTPRPYSRRTPVPQGSDLAFQHSGKRFAGLQDLTPTPGGLCGGGDLRVVEVGLVALGALDERGRRGETLAVGGGELLGPLDEAGEAVVGLGLISVDVLEHAAGPAGEADAHDRADVRVGDRLDHALVEALDRLDRLDEQHPLLEVAQRDRRRVRDRRERLAQALPEPGALAVGVLVEAAALELAGAVVLVEHRGDDLLGRVG